MPRPSHSSRFYHPKLQNINNSNAFDGLLLLQLLCTKAFLYLRTQSSREIVIIPFVVLKDTKHMFELNKERPT